MDTPYILPGTPGKRLFPLGALVITSAASEALPRVDVAHGLRRHAAGLWGDLSDNDRVANDMAVEHVGRILSAYGSTRGRHLMVAEALRSKIPLDFYHSFLENQFDPPQAQPSPAHRLLLLLQPRFLITTNYDRLLENAYANMSRKAMTVLDYSDSGAVQRKIQDERHKERPFLYKIHGDIEDTASIILTENDYRRLLYDELGYQTVLASIFIHFVVLFLGFSLSDDELLIHLAKLRHALKGASYPDYILFSDKNLNRIEIERFRNDFGLEVILYPHDANHTGLVNFLEELHRRSSVTSP